MLDNVLPVSVVDSEVLTVSKLPKRHLQNRVCLMDILDEVQSRIAPLWPLEDFVAVNPLVGFTQQRFLHVRQRLSEVREADLLMPTEYYCGLLASGEITQADVQEALKQCAAEYPEVFDDQFARDWDSLLQAQVVEASRGKSQRAYWTLAEVMDGLQDTSWTSTIVGEISRHCAAHYDQGQAIWQSPWKDLPLYEAWRETAKLDRRFEKLGVHGFRQFVSELSNDPHEVVQGMLLRMGVPETHWQNFLLTQLYSINGWASYIKYRVRSAEIAERTDDDLIGLLAMRLAYDCALLESNESADRADLWRRALPSHSNRSSHDQHIPEDVAVRYGLQVASEVAYRRRLQAELLVPHPSHDTSSGQSKVQMIFCIDVRSELVRRHLESVSSDIETFGFAGFFGLPMEYVSMGSMQGSDQCPVLLTPSFRVQERLQTEDSELQAEAVAATRLGRTREKIWKLFQSSAVSCFSFVESVGLLYAVALVKSAWGLRRDSIDDAGKHLSSDQRKLVGPCLPSAGEDEVSVSRRVELAAGILKNLGLTDNFARVVAICGHASETANNPYRAGLDCGACGGHSGKSNARVAAMLLNDPQVRAGLSEQGLVIPDSTWFVPGAHNTTTDEIEFFDSQAAPDTHAVDLNELRGWVALAGERTRSERASRLGAQLPAEIFSRSRDWSEVRPEWGLAGNAAFLVAPRSRTKGIRLDGRTFMHSYDWRKDTDLKVLELIMTAPMVVANWINLQYYASTVDNKAYGSGNKVLHNVVGLFGIQQGNGGDLMTGLPWQSVHDGHNLQHLPLRLSVIIENKRDAVQTIIDKHAIVQELAGNGWLTLLALEDEQLYTYSASQGWTLSESTVYPVVS